jgi:multiple sugar transport system substrate-binding protein
VAISAGEEAELYSSDPLTPQLVKEKKIVPLTELPNFKDVLDSYDSYQVEGITKFDGVPYIIPFRQNVYGMAYNKDMMARIGFSGPPKTWDEFEKACVAISKLGPGKTFGTAIPLKMGGFVEAYCMSSIIPSIGHFQFDVTTGRYKFADMDFYFDMFNRLREAKALFPGLESLDDDSARAQFSEGNIGFIFGGSYNVGVWYDQFPAKVNWDVAQYPVKDISSAYNGYSTLGGLIVVSQRCRTQGVLDKAGEVLRLLASDEMRKATFTTGKDIPTKTDLLKTAAPSDRPQWNSYASVNANFVVRPPYPDQFFTIEGDNIENIFSRMLLGVTPPVQGLADLEKRYNEALDRAVSRGAINLKNFMDPSAAAKFKAGH